MFPYLLSIGDGRANCSTYISVNFFFIFPSSYLNLVSIGYYKARIEIISKVDAGLGYIITDHAFDMFQIKQKDKKVPLLAGNSCIVCMYGLLTLILPTPLVLKNVGLLLKCA